MKTIPDKHSPALKFPDSEAIKKALASFSGAEGHTPAEMAFPAYLHRCAPVRWLMLERYRRIIRLAEFEKYPHKPRVLEFGCGPGLALPFLAEQSSALYAVDLFTAPAEAMCASQGISAIFSKGLSGIPEKSIDLIIAADVLEHIENPGKTLRELRTLLTGEGLMIVSGPTENLFYRAGRSALRLLPGGSVFTGDYHASGIDEVDRRARAAGFKARTREKIPGFPLPALFKIIKYSGD